MHTQPATRRSVLAGGVSVAAALPLAGSAACAMATSGGLVAEVRGLAVRHFKAICAEAMAEDVHGSDLPEHAAAIAERRTADLAFEALSERIYRLPVTCFDDIVARAEIASFWGDRDDNGEIEHLHCNDWSGTDDRAVAQLLRAILDLAGGDPVGAIRQEIDRELQNGGHTNV